MQSTTLAGMPPRAAGKHLRAFKKGATRPFYIFTLLCDAILILCATNLIFIHKEFVVIHIESVVATKESAVLTTDFQ
jgi:hypothetical protein